MFSQRTGVLCVVALVTLAGFSSRSNAADEVKIIKSWDGTYPSNKLELFPKGQQETNVGWIGDAKTFAAVWKAYKPDESVPEVDFKDNMVVFARNVKFYNRINIFKVTTKNGTADIAARETQTARPIDDKLCISFAVIPREGIKKLANGDNPIDVNP